MNNLKQLKQELEETKNKCAELEKKIEELEKQKSEVRWRAKGGGKYYYCCGHEEICADRDGRYIIDTGRYNLGNYFETEEEAKKAVEKIKIYTQLKDLALRLNKGRKIDWTNNGQAKYYIYYDHGTMWLNYYHDWSYQSIGQIYCLDENFLEEAKREMGEKNLRKLFE